MCRGIKLGLALIGGEVRADVEEAVLYSDNYFTLLSEGIVGGTLFCHHGGQQAEVRTQLVDRSVGFKPDVGLADTYSSYEVCLAGISPAGVNSGYLHGGMDCGDAAVYETGLEIDDVVLGGAGFIEKNDAAIIEVEGDSCSRVVLNAVPKFRLLVDVLKNNHGAFITPAEELLVF